MLNKQFYFTPTYACNNKCVMCGVEKNKRDKKESFGIQEAKSLIDKMNLTSKDILEFSGGEPTLYKGFQELVKYAKDKYNPRILILSHGRQLSNKTFTKSLKNIGIERFIIPLFSHNAKTHDFITQIEGSFKQTCEGFQNLEEEGIPYSIKFIVMKPNYKDLPFVYQMKKEKFDNAKFIISGYQLMGEAIINKDIVSTMHSKVVRQIEETLDKAEEVGEFVPLFMFPMCIIDPCYWQYYGVGVFQEEIIAPDQKEIELNSKLNYEEKPTKCKRCILKERCTWAWKDYVFEYGDKELNPLEASSQENSLFT